MGATELQRRLVTDAKRTPDKWFLAEVPSTPLEQSVRDADRAYRNFFDSLSGKRKGPKMGKPRRKLRKDHRQSARFTRSAGFAVHQTTHGVGKVRLPKVGWVRFVLSRRLPSGPSSVTIIRNSDGTYQVSFVVDATPRQAPQPAHQVAGVDVGLASLAAITYSDGGREKIANPRHLARAQAKLVRAQKDLSRKQKGSKNRAKARLRVARAHAKVRNTRGDHQHKLARRLVDENQVIAVENLHVRGLARSGAKGKRGRGMRRSVADAGWSALIRLLEEKVVEAGRTLVRVDPAYTSQTCSVCGVLDGPKPLHVRQWTCSGCGAWLDRDYNAAVNIMKSSPTGGGTQPALACGGPSHRRTCGDYNCRWSGHKTATGLCQYRSL